MPSLYIAEAAGDVRTAQILLGHAELARRSAYLGQPSIERLLVAVEGLRLGPSERLPLATQ